MRFFDIIRRGLRKMFSYNSVGRVFDVDIAVSSKMEEALRLWVEMLEDRPPWKDLDKGKMTLNLPTVIASEVARLVTIEMESTVSGSPRADFINEQYQRVIDKARVFTDFACGKGGIVMKPYIVGKGDDAKVPVAIVQPEEFFPVDFDSDGDVTSAVFTDYRYIGNKKYTRLEFHRLEGTTITISNKAYCAAVSEVSMTMDEVLGKEVSLAEVEEWADIQPEVVIENMQRPLFVYFKMPTANNVEPRSPLGVSVFSKATGLIKKADELWSEISWEYEGGELAVNVSNNILTTDRFGKPQLPAGKERLYRRFEYDGGSGTPIIQPYSPEFRDQSLFNGLDENLKKVELACGLAYGTISIPPDIERTATEVQNSKQRSYATVSDIQKALQRALEHLVYTIDVFTTLYTSVPQGPYEITFQWDDSIIVDAEAERLRDQQEVAQGLMKKWEYRVKWYGETEEKAKQMVGEGDEEDRTNDEILKFITNQPPAPDNAPQPQAEGTEAGEGGSGGNQ